ncbi:hypothetical protein EDD70_2278 [Hydrogenoanaerobacterium saccharovorans]|uniref:Uncharacterized protein n=1 Tax=Hydrogenoanaerobacterium saccharovorans TaxID=474960 RepID=A0A1H8CTR0_9FIRM|nr:hypothetical protein EDD70_2278 [Hydrogenoanaerobacterium saccharovorans]SEM98533.1 hypothetical protein SAMN05216180_2336 [Hydrogenoanaerobacterium saccharovorans]
MIGAINKNKAVVLSLKKVVIYITLLLMDII